MAISEAVAPSTSDAAPTFDGAAAPPSEGAAALPSGKKTAALFMATLVLLGSVGALGYTQWWIPREEAKRAQVTYEHCLDEVEVYVGTHSYASRLAQCTQFLDS